MIIDGIKFPDEKETDELIWQLEHKIQDLSCGIFERKFVADWTPNNIRDCSIYLNLLRQYRDYYFRHQ